jgi:hypothetical protein
MTAPSNGNGHVDVFDLAPNDYAQDAAAMTAPLTAVPPYEADPVVQPVYPPQGGAPQYRPEESGHPFPPAQPDLPDAGTYPPPAAYPPAQAYPPPPPPADGYVPEQGYATPADAYPPAYPPAPSEPSEPVVHSEPVVAETSAPAQHLRMASFSLALAGAAHVLFAAGTPSDSATIPAPVAPARPVDSRAAAASSAAVLADLDFLG